MPNVVVPTVMPQLIQPYQYVRSGLIPQARWAKQLINALNYIRYNRRKEVFSSDGQIVTIPAGGGAGARNRWYFRFRTGYGVRRLRISWEMALFAGAAAPPFANLKLTPAGGGSTVDVPIYFGNVDAGTIIDDSLDELGRGVAYSGNLAENTVYEGSWTDNDNSRLVSVCCFEEGKWPSTENGYLDPNYSAFQPIFDKYREDILAAATNMFNRNCAPLIKWSTGLETECPSIAIATDTNIIDGATAVSATSAGFYVDSTNNVTLNNAVVPCVFGVRASTSATTNGIVKLKDDTGTLATISGIGTTDQWYTVTLDLPANGKKRDITMQMTGGTLKVRAACLYMEL